MQNWSVMLMDLVALEILVVLEETCCHHLAHDTDLGHGRVGSRISPARHLRIVGNVLHHFVVDCQADILCKEMEQAQVQAAASGIAAIDAPAGPKSV